MHATLESARRYQDVLAATDPHKQFAFDTIFDESSLLARRRSRWKFRLLQRLAPRLRRMLGPDERVRYITRGKRFSFWEEYFGGLAIGFLNRRGVIVTSQRIILVQLGNRQKPKELVEQIRYAGVERVSRTLFGNTRIRFSNGSRIKLANVPRADRKFLIRLIEYTRAQLPREDVALEKLCCYCYQPVAGHPDACPHCHGKYVAPRKAAILSLIFPGVGDFYLGHHLFAATEIAIAGVAWIILVKQVQVGLAASSSLLFLFFMLHGGDSKLTHHIAKMGLAPVVRPKLTATESAFQLVSVVGVFVSVIFLALAYRYYSAPLRDLQEQRYQRAAIMSTPQAEQFRAAQAALVEQITVQQAAERIAARDSEWSVVVLWATHSSTSRSMFPELAALYQKYSSHGVAFRIFSVDYDDAMAEIPVFLARHQMRVPPVRLRRWASGQLSSAMMPLGIQIGATWKDPLVALLDRNGTVIWQQQGFAYLDDLATIMEQRIGRESGS